MFSKLSEAGAHFWLYFTIFLILILIIWWLVIRRWGSCKTRAVLGSKWVWMLNIFNVFALMGFISGAPCSHLIFGIFIYWIVAIIIVAVWRNGGCGGCFGRRGWGNWRRGGGSCDDSCASSNNDSNCSSNNNSNCSNGSNNSCDDGFKRRCNYRINWPWWLFALFWAIVGALAGLLFRHIKLSCLLSHFQKLVWAWWAFALLGVLLFFLLWQVAFKWANCRARCVALNKRTWFVLWFWTFLWLGALSGSSWWIGLLVIVILRAIAWGLSFTWPYFCAPRNYCWGTIVAAFIGYIIGVYIIRYLELPDGAYLLKCGPTVFPALKTRFL